MSDDGADHMTYQDRPDPDAPVLCHCGKPARWCVCDQTKDEAGEQ